MSDDPIGWSGPARGGVLRQYRIDGRPVLNLENARDAARLREILAMTARFNSETASVSQHGIRGFDSRALPGQVDHY